MNFKFLILGFAFTLFYTSCGKFCDDYYKVPTILLNYENYKSETELNIYSKIQDDSLTVIFQVDEIDLVLKEHNYHLDIEDRFDNFIIVLGDSVRIDTLTDLSNTRYGKCNNSIDVKYTHNGIVKEEGELIFE